MLKYVKCLLYAADIKLYAIIDNTRNAINFQYDLNIFSDMYNDNDLLLNL